VRFDAWLEAQRAPAREPGDAAARRGREVFLARGCPLCHGIRGLPAHGRIGPDLTHLASRRTLAAGALPRTPGHLAAWIVAPGSAKPGTKMPPVRLEAGELKALVAFLGGLE
jgi:cytochrome c oxidase subunit 2